MKLLLSITALSCALGMVAAPAVAAGQQPAADQQPPAGQRPPAGEQGPSLGHARWNGWGFASSLPAMAR